MSRTHAPIVLRDVATLEGRFLAVTGDTLVMAPTSAHDGSDRILVVPRNVTTQTVAGAGAIMELREGDLDKTLITILAVGAGLFLAFGFLLARGLAYD